MNCIKCNELIPKERVELIPDAWTCAPCSAEQPYFGVMVFDHKTAGRVVYVRREAKESVNILKRFNTRARR